MINSIIQTSRARVLLTILNLSFFFSFLHHSYSLYAKPILTQYTIRTAEIMYDTCRNMGIFLKFQTN